MHECGIDLRKAEPLGARFFIKPERALGIARRSLALAQQQSDVAHGGSFQIFWHAVAFTMPECGLNLRTDEHLGPSFLITPDREPGILERSHAISQQQSTVDAPSGKERVSTC